MIRIAICDDEEKILNEVAGYIESYAEKKVGKDLKVFRFDSASALLGVLEDGKPFDINGRNPQRKTDFAENSIFI